ncbi:Addiction module toxin, RelE/StbE [Candidatus Magnetoovum chiemensis]|nr:Addiction module toxin, RelE/StbE [Candidatus Magnetoovum chiemensis]
MIKNPYKAEFTERYKKDFKKIKRNNALVRRLKGKIKEILKDPYHYKPLRNVLKNKRRSKIGSFVLIFEISEEEEVIIFEAIAHHDTAYE